MSETTRNLTSAPESRGRLALRLVGLLLLCFGIAAVGGVSTAEAVREWYPGLDKPPWTPPNWAFGPIWTTLYTAMAVAMWDVRRKQGCWTREIVLCSGVQLALNLAWSPVFFAMQATGPALVVISALWLAIVACIVIYGRTSRLAGGLMVPYLAWISVALSLNAWIWWFNP